MTVNILSLYKKTWPGNKFSVSFLHDSIRCEHCLQKKIHFEPQIKNKSDIQSFDPPSVEDLSKSCFHQSHLRSFMKIEHNRIPESSFCTLGVKLTKSVAAKLSQRGDVKNPFHRQYRKRHNVKSIKSSCNTKNCVNKKLKKCSKIEVNEPIDKDSCDNYFPPAEEPLVNDCSNVKKQKIPIKKPISPEKLIKIVKEPSKGTLKRKRWKLQKLKETNENYEDDLFEDQKFCSFQSIIEDDSDSGRFDGMRTPQIGLSPVRDGSSTPSCTDCYSPGELFSNRKEAEEYIFRREKRRKLKLQDDISESEPSPEKPIRIDKTITILHAASKILSKAVLKAEKCEKASDEDEYFTDNSESSD